MALLKQSTTYTRAFLLIASSDHLTGLTGATATVNLSKAGGTFAAAGGTVTEIANGWYKVALTTTDTNTLGDLAYHITATSADPTDFTDQVVVDLPGGSVSSVTGAVGSVTGNVGGNVVGSVASVTAGVTVTTNNDKTGYSLTQAFPTNFSSLAITVGGAVTAGTVSDKTGYSLSQAFPANFSALSITAGGLVAETQASSDQVWSSVTRTLTSPGFPANFAAMNISAGGAVLTQGNQGIKKNTALAAFGFLMTDSTNHAPKTALTVSASRSLDGAAFAACANAVVEVGSGIYKIDLAATDLNANVVVLRFTATGADDRDLTIVTSP